MSRTAGSTREVYHMQQDQWQSVRESPSAARLTKALRLDRPFEQPVEKSNPNHDEKGRFSSGGSSAGGDENRANTEYHEKMRDYHYARAEESEGRKSDAHLKAGDA